MIAIAQSNLRARIVINCTKPAQGSRGNSNWKCARKIAGLDDIQREEGYVSAPMTSDLCYLLEILTA